MTKSLFKDIEALKLLLENFYIKYNKLPQKYKPVNEEERRLSVILQQMRCPSARQYNKDLVAWLKEKGYIKQPILINQQLIKDFLKENDRLPKQHASSKEEKRLYIVMQSYITRHHSSYDPGFHEWIKSIRILIKKNEQLSKTINELRKKNNLSNNSFKKLNEIKKTLHKNSHDPIGKKEELIKMAINNENKPLRLSKLGLALKRYTLQSSNCFDPAFTEKIKKIAPHWFME